MKKFTIALLGVIFVTLIAGSVQSVTADHLFEDENVVNHVSTKDSKYQIHIQVQVRNEQGQLVSISESLYGYYIPHEISDHTFESVKKQCNNLLERLSHERVEVNNVQRRIEELSLECIELTQPKKEMVQESAVSYLDSSGNTLTEHENIFPDPPIENSESSIQVSTEEQDNHEDSPKSNESDYMPSMNCNN